MPARLKISNSVVSSSIGKHGATVDIAASASAGRLAFETGLNDYK